MQITAKHRHERKGDLMTMKTKRGLAVGGGTIFCAALAILIATRFAPEPEAVAPNTSETSSTTPISVEISTAKREETKPIEIEKPAASTSVPDNSTPTKSDPEKEAANFIDNGGIEINQDFSEPEETESAPQNEPPEPPKIEDEEMLTNPDKEPTYSSDQTTVTEPDTPSGTPKHGDKKDGMIYINGFGWIKDEGGGGRGEAAPDMYENGNKIGYFG